MWHPGNRWIQDLLLSRHQAYRPYNKGDGKYNVETDWLRATGRGIGVTRPTDWAQRTLWVYPGFDDNKEDHQDLRHNPAVGFQDDEDPR